jgi:predicted permease
LTLALGIGANTAIFSLIDTVLLKRLPVKAPEQLVMLSHTGESGNSHGFLFECYEQLRDHDQMLSDLLAYYPLRLTASVNGQAEPALNGQLVTGNYYAALGVNALLGRTLAPEDDRTAGAHPVCVISEDYWQRRFGRDPSVVGKTIHLSGRPFTIIGVTPPEFFGAEVGSAMDITVPVAMRKQVMPGTGFWNDAVNQFRVMGRLRPGVTLEQAQASLGLLYQQAMADLVASRAGGLKGRGAWDFYLKQRLMVASGSQGQSALRQQFSQSWFVLMSVVALVLLIACANVAGLLLARGVARRKEMAVRLALGAGRLRLVRQLLTESMLLAVLGSLLGLFFAWWGTQLLLSLCSQREIPLHLNLNPDLRVLGFTAAVAVLTGVLFGLVPAVAATRVDLQSMLKQEAPGMSGCATRLSFGQVFVIAQVALSLPLLIGAGLFVRSLEKLQQVETGYTRENVLVMKLEPIHSDDKGNYRVQLTALYDELLRRVAALPGVRQASLVGYSPITRNEWLAMGETPEQSSLIYLVGKSPRSEEEMRIHWMQVYPNSFATLGLPLLAGRDFRERDNWSAQEVAVINESMARRFFGSENPIGQRFGLGRAENPGNILEIIGVVKDARYTSLREPARPMFYRAFAQATTGRAQMTLVARTTGDPAPIAAVLQREAQALDPAMPRFTAETLLAQLAVSLTQERLIATLSSVFGLLALALASIGLYGALSFTVAQRTHELGLRLALGAQPVAVLRLVVGQGMKLIVLGLVFGLAGTLALTRVLRGILFGVSTTDPLTFAAITLLLLAVALLACWIPARRATKVDPLVALRCE